MSKISKFKMSLIVIGILLLSLTLFIYFQNKSIGVTNIEYSNKKVPFAFNGYKVLHVSDLHNEEFGENNKKLIEKTKEVRPDIIVITGDLIDSNKTSIEVAMAYIKEVVKICPVYFVTGNHEKWSGLNDELTGKLKAAGVKVLNNEEVEIKKGEESISLLGIEDPAFLENGYDGYGVSNAFEENIKNLMNNKSDKLTILLSHRPEYMDMYTQLKVDLVLTGHAHGGQFRLPFIGGVVAPDQGFFPRYTSGMYVENDTSMIVSRGLGNSIIHVRVFNPPELVLVTLKHVK